MNKAGDTGAPDRAAGDLLAILGLPADTPIDRVEARFLEQVRENIQSVAASYDEQAAAAEELRLRRLHALFFRHVIAQAAGAVKKPQDKKDHPDAGKLKKKAQALVKKMQAMIIDYATCYMQINRFTTLLRDEIRAEETKLGGHADRGVKWTSDAGTIIGRYRRDKKMLLADTERMAAARAVLVDIEPHTEVIRHAVTGLFGADRAEAYTRRIMSALRLGDLQKARSAARTIAEEKKKFGLDSKTAAELQGALSRSTEAVCTTIETHKNLLTGGEDKKLFLRPVETDMAYNSHLRELRKIKAFLAKYHLPYMEYKLDSLQHLRDKLLVVGSLDGLMVLYRRLVAGLAVPLADIRDVRLYESEIVEKIDYLLQGQYTEIPRIRDRAHELVREFREGKKEYEEITIVDDMEEVAVEGQKAASQAH